MAANVESMFYIRETPWHGLGTKVQEAPTSKDALILAGLDWHVIQEPVYTGKNELVQGYKANVRNSDRKVLGVVTDRYKIVQNEEAFSFTDALLGEGVRYETAGSYRVEKVSGYWHIYLMNTLFPGRESVRICCFPTHMMALVQ